MKGVVRPEKILDPDYYIEFLLKKVDKKSFEQVYGIEGWTDTEDFLKKLAIRYGRLMKQNEPDIKSIS